MTTELTKTNNVALNAAESMNRFNTIASFDTTTTEGMAKAFNAGMGADHKVEDCIGEHINLVGFFIEVVDTVNDTTGEPEQMPHVVLFADNGDTYEAFSVGMYSSTERLARMISSNSLELDEEHPIEIEFKARKAKLGRMYCFAIVA